MIKKRLIEFSGNEIDALLLNDWLKEYKKPKDVITRLVNTGVLNRVKQGLYIKGEEYSAISYSPEILANLIYGPSYISFEYALSYYGFIPERVLEITSVTPKRNKLFQTPIGTYRYRYQALNKYITGLTQVRYDDSRFFLIATKEKALVDCLTRDESQFSGMTISEILEMDYRIDRVSLSYIKINKLKLINKEFKSKLVFKLINYLQEGLNE